MTVRTRISRVSGRTGAKRKRSTSRARKRGRIVNPIDTLDLRIQELIDLLDGWYVNPQGDKLGKAPSWTALRNLRRFALAWMPDDAEEDLLPDVEGGVSLFYDGPRDVVRVRFHDDGTVVAELYNDKHPVDLTSLPRAVEGVRALLQKRKRAA